MSETYKYDVFISHSSESLDCVEQVAKCFEENGLDCWYAPRNLDNTGAGKDYDDEIVCAIHNSRCIVVILNDTALRSKWVKREVSQAEKQDKMVFPFAISELSENNGLLMRIEDRHIIQAYPEYENKIPTLLENIKSFLGQNPPKSHQKPVNIKDKPSPTHKSGRITLKLLKKVVKKEPQNAFQYVDMVEKQLLRSLKKFYGGRANELSEQVVTLWIMDRSKYNLLSQNHDRFLTNIRDDGGFKIINLIVKEGSNPQEATIFFDGIAYTIGDSVSIDNPRDSKQALLQINENKGTLIDGERRISADGGCYFIGRGAVGRNSIGIASDSSDPNYDLNKYVRSHHARIKFIEGLGFCIFVEKDGTQAFGGSRTQIQRYNDDELIELNNPQQPLPLHSGDIIILGKSVEILFLDY